MNRPITKISAIDAMNSIGVSFFSGDLLACVFFQNANRVGFQSGEAGHFTNRNARPQRTAPGRLQILAMKPSILPLRAVASELSRAPTEKYTSNGRPTTFSRGTKPQ